MGPGILPETTVGKHNPSCHLQMPTKALLCKKVQKLRRVLWAKAHLKWTVPKWKIVQWSDESKFDILVGNHECLVLQAKEEGDLSACYQRWFFLNQCRISILLCVDLIVTLMCVKHNLLQVFLNWWVKSARYAAQKWVAWPFWEGRGLYTAKETISSTKQLILNVFLMRDFYFKRRAWKRLTLLSDAV